MTFRRSQAIFVYLGILLAASCARANVDAGSLNESVRSTPASPSPSGTEEPSTQELPVGILTIKSARGDMRFDVQIAETAEARSRGLMGVEQLEPSEGMVFLFQASSKGGFWMKNTLIPLDIAFWNEEMKIVDILHMEPCKEDPCQIYTPRAEYIGAAEVAKGGLEKNGVGIGNEVALSRPD